MKIPKRATWIDRDLIISPYCIGLCQTEKSFYRELKRLKVPRSSWPKWIPKRKHAAVHRFHYKSKVWCLVCVKTQKKGDPLLTIGLLIHESVHLWQVVKKAIYEHKPSREFEAYAIQNISQRLIKAYKIRK